MDDLIGFPPRYDPASPTRLPAFWRGALATRQAFKDGSPDPRERAWHESAMREIDDILAAIDAGGFTPELPAYRRWLAWERRVL